MPAFIHLTWLWSMSLTFLNAFFCCLRTSQPVPNVIVWVHVLWFMVGNSVTPNKMSVCVCMCVFSSAYSPDSGYSSVYNDVQLCSFFCFVFYNRPYGNALTSLCLSHPHPSFYIYFLPGYLLCFCSLSLALSNWFVLDFLMQLFFWSRTDIQSVTLGANYENTKSLSCTDLLWALMHSFRVSE